jgi:adenine-specific DNA glycosylase
VAVIARGGRVLMARREGAQLAGLWEPPGTDLANGAAAAPALRAALARLGARARLTATGRVVRHTITHRTITAEVWRGTPIGATPRRANLRWVDPARPAVPLTALARKLTRHDSP